MSAVGAGCYYVAKKKKYNGTTRYTNTYNGTTPTTNEYPRTNELNDVSIYATANANDRTPYQGDEGITWWWW